MTPFAAIAALDRAIAANSQTVTLRRYVGLGPSRVPYDATVQAHVRGYAPAELVGGIMQGDVRVIVSPTPIIAQGWPGPQDWPRMGDKVVIGGREHNVEAAPPLLMAGEVVRIEIQARG